MELLDFPAGNSLFHCVLHQDVQPKGDHHFRREQILHLVCVEQCIDHIRSLLSRLLWSERRLLE